MANYDNPYPWLTLGAMWKPVTAILQAADVSGVIFISDGHYMIHGVRESHSVPADADGTLQIEVLTAGQDADAGVDQLQSAINLSATADTPQTGTVITEPTMINPGDMIGVVLGGTLTNMVNACVTVYVEKMNKGM